MNKTYYYIDSDVIEEYDNYAHAVVRKKAVLCFEDYPLHKHKSSKVVNVHQLFTLEEIKRVRSLESNIGRFSKIVLERDDVFYTATRERYEKAFEKNNNTLIWQQYKGE